jgi:hypothetical protein
MNTDSSSPFRQAEERYFSLRGQLDTGRITRAQFDEAMAQLMLRDPQGRYWALGSDTGRWNVFQSGAWVEAMPDMDTPPPPPGLPPTLPDVRAAPPPAPVNTTPPPSPVYAAPPPSPVYTALPTSPARAAAPAAPAQSSGGWGCGRTLGCGCLLLVLLLVVCGVGGYWAYTNHVVTQATFLNLAGLGPARIEVDNFRDDGINVTFSQLDATKDSSPIQGALQLNAFDVKTFHTPNAAKFRIDFVASTSRTNLGTCTLSAKSGDQFQFVALPDKIVINHVNNPPKTGTDLIMQTSTLCR